LSSSRSSRIRTISSRPSGREMRRVLIMVLPVGRGFVPRQQGCRIAGCVLLRNVGKTPDWRGEFPREYSALFRLDRFLASVGSRANLFSSIDLLRLSRRRHNPCDTHLLCLIYWPTA
jgi:hypothetical protein